MLRVYRGLRVLLGLGGLIFLVLFTLSPVAKAEDPLVVGHTDDYPPLNFMRDGKLVGIEVDNAREIGQMLGREVKSVVLPFSELMSALKAGKIDVVMAGVSITPEREREVLFIQPFMEVGQMAIILADKAVNFANPRSVYRAGIRIGVEPNTTGERFVRERVGTAKVQYYDNSEAAFQALRSSSVASWMACPQEEKLVPSQTNAPMAGCSSTIRVVSFTSCCSHASVSIQSRFFTKTL